MIIALLASSILGISAFFAQRWLPNDIWLAYAGIGIFALSVLGMLVYAALKPKT